MGKRYSVELTKTAEAAYRRICEEAEPHLESGDTGSAKVKLRRIVDECLDKIISDDPFNPKRALSGKLSNIFRVKKGRIRICYAGSSETRRITILYISETPRKDGDKNDPYEIFTSLVMSGKFDRFFEALGMRRPSRHGGRGNPPIQ